MEQMILEVLQNPVSLALVGVVVVVVAIGVAVARKRLLSARRPHAITERPAPEEGEEGAARGQEPAERAEEVVAPPAEVSLAQRFFKGLSRSREALSRGLGRWFGSGGVDRAALESLEEALILADVGVRTTSAIVEAVAAKVRDAADPDTLHALLRSELLKRLGSPRRIPEPGADRPLAILVVGVNGSGKTTTIGKLAARYRRDGKKVLLAAGDTFRAGAIEQLRVWGERTGAPVIAHQEGADPAAVIFDALRAGKARGMDVVICDTAGRLQAQKPLMDQLGKVVRAMGKALEGAPHEVLLVLDATIGQNALSQARIFKEVVGVTGVVLTKLDGTAKGGVVIAVTSELGLPVELVGLGEQVDDLRDFEPEAFVDALLGPSPSALAGEAMGERDAPGD